MRIVFLAFFLLSNLHAKTLDRVVAVVQGKAILLSDVQSLRSQVQNSPLMKNFYKFDGAITDEKILKRLVEVHIVRARLKELGTEISGESVNREISEISRKNKLSVAQLKSILGKQGVDFDNYFDALKSEIEKRAIMNREVSANSPGLSDEELKSVYRTKAPMSYKVSILVDEGNAKSKALLEEIASKFKTGSLSVEKVKDHPGYVSLGWLMAPEVADHFKKGLENAQTNSVVGPVKKDGKYQLLLVEETQRGSDEQFERVKDTFRESQAGLENEKKFDLWLEKQMNQLEVTVNSL